MRKSKTCEYFLASRLFEMAELKILIDSVQSSHFITKRKSELLIKKLKGLVSKPQARDFSGQICIYDRIKSMNESIFYNVDTLHNAIASNRKITFRYFDYNIKRKKVFRKNGGYYCTNPVALTFDNENYYLIAFNEKYEDFVHYKVDRMTDIAVGEERRIMPKNPFNAANYVKPLFSMFDGKMEDITAVFDSAYLNVVIDRFGKNVRLTELEADCFRADFQAAVSPTFLAWLISFGTNAYMTKDFSAKL